MTRLVRAERWLSTGVVVLVLAVIGYLSDASMVSLPMLQDVVPTRLLVALIASAAVLTPLYATFAQFSYALVRQARLRPVRILAVLVMAGIAFLPAMRPGDLRIEAAVDARLYLALLALGIVAVTTIGDYAWAAVLGVGFTSLVLLSAPASPLASVLHTTPTWVFAAAVALASVGYTVFGPRVAPGYRPE